MFLARTAHADDGAWAELRGREIVLFRHANAPGTGDPLGFAIGDCSTQRNLDERGRAQARAIGAAFRTRGIRVGRVLSSHWCRSRDTAELAFPDRSALNRPSTPFSASERARTVRRLMRSGCSAIGQVPVFWLWCRIRSTSRRLPASPPNRVRDRAAAGGRADQGSRSIACPGCLGVDSY